MNRFRRAIALSVLILSLIVFLFSFTGATNKEAIRAAALIVFAMGFWATGVLPEYLTAMIFLLTATIAKVAPPPVVFPVFSQAPSGWFSAVW